MLEKIFPTFLTGRMALGLLILRVIAGGALMQHGWGKIQNPFHWMDKGPDPAPAIFQVLAALAEFGGGLALILGLLTPLAAFGIACTMLVAILKVHINDPWVPAPGAKGGSFELALGYLSVVTTLILTGPGVLSLDAILFGKKRTDEKPATSRESFSRPVVT